ncbi:hypothetical protein ACP275_09G120400 [Erythranthe tilingii]
MNSRPFLDLANRGRTAFNDDDARETSFVVAPIEAATLISVIFLIFFSSSLLSPLSLKYPHADVSKTQFEYWCLIIKGRLRFAFALNFLFLFLFFLCFILEVFRGFCYKEMFISKN